MQNSENVEEKNIGRDVTDFHENPPTIFYRRSPSLKDEYYRLKVEVKELCEMVKDIFRNFCERLNQPSENLNHDSKYTCQKVPKKITCFKNKNKKQ